MIRDVPRLADRRAVVEALRGAARPGARARGARRRPRGLEDVKDRIVEYLAVRKLRQERGIPEDKRSGAILTLIGPPGTGKTSIGESIARALGREFVRMSLGGVRDEAEIRGHRRTYIGALPGRLVRALRDAGTMNPVIMLDEVDKVGADWRGDPSAALLEVLDPAQNHSFRDHYLDVELDLSRGRLHRHGEHRRHDPRPAARPDGGHPLRRLHGRREGRDRARLPLAAAARAQRPARGRGRDLRRRCSETVVTEYTREAGVRQLERELGKVLRKTATKIASGTAEAPVAVDLDAVRDALGRQKFFQEAAERTAVPGVATGLAVTGTGGDVLFVEATSMKGDGRLLLTGQLGDVMKESARIALSYVRSHAAELGIDESAFDGRDVPRPRAGGRDPEGRARAPASRWRPRSRRSSRAAGEAHRRDDRRGDAPGPRAADRRAEAEGARRPRGRADRRHPARAEPRRPRRRAGGRARGDVASTPS